jgi:predicted nucleic acid-binding protein
MKFWDASAIISLLADRAEKAVQPLAEKSPILSVWWATEVECASAIARLERDDALDDAAATQAFHGLKQLAQTWREVDPSDPIREAPCGSCACITLGRRMRFSSPPP